MSYCRWSSDNFQCDLYCYESDDGFITHVSDGQTFVDSTAEQLLNRINELKAMGYRVPKWVFDLIAEDIQEDEA